MLCSPEDTAIGMHGQHCKIILSWMSYKASSACDICSQDVGQLLRRKLDQERLEKYIAECNIIPEGNTKDKRKGKKGRKKGGVDKVQTDCDCLKAKKLRLSSNCHHMPIGPRGSKDFNSVVHPVTLVENKATQPHNAEIKKESKHVPGECNLGNVVPTITNEETSISMSQEDHEVDILPSTTKEESKELLMSESNIINVVPTITEEIKESLFAESNVECSTKTEHSEKNDNMSTETPSFESNPFIPDIKPEIQNDCLVFLPQRSMLRVKTVPTSETEPETNTAVSESETSSSSNCRIQTRIVKTKVQESDEYPGLKSKVTLKSIYDGLPSNLKTTMTTTENLLDLQQTTSMNDIVPPPLTKTSTPNTITMSINEFLSRNVSKKADSMRDPSDPILRGALANSNKKVYNISFKSLGLKSALPPKSPTVLGTCDSLGLKSIFEAKCASDNLVSTPRLRLCGNTGKLLDVQHNAPIILQTVQGTTLQSNTVIQQTIPHATLPRLPILQPQPQAAVSTLQNTEASQSVVSTFRGSQVNLPLLLPKPQPIVFKVIPNNESANTTQSRDKFTVSEYPNPTVSKQSENTAMSDKTGEVKPISKSAQKMETECVQTLSPETKLGVNSAKLRVYYTETPNKDPVDSIGQAANCGKKKVMKKIVFCGVNSYGGNIRSTVLPSSVGTSFKNEEITEIKPNGPVVSDDGAVLPGDVGIPFKTEEIAGEKLSSPVNAVTPGDVASDSAVLPGNVEAPLKREEPAGIPVKVEGVNCKNVKETRKLSAVSVRCTLCDIVLQGVGAFMVHAQEHSENIGDPFSHAVIRVQ